MQSKSVVKGDAVCRVMSAASACAQGRVGGMSVGVLVGGGGCCKVGGVTRIVLMDDANWNGEREYELNDGRVC